MERYICSVCGYVYDESKGIPESGIAPGTKWEDLPDDWVCPICGVDKSSFDKEKKIEKTSTPVINVSTEENNEFSSKALAAICSNLAKGCNKQYLEKEEDLFNQLSIVFEQKSPDEECESFNEIFEKIDNDINTLYPSAQKISDEEHDRGSGRALLWSLKVSRLIKSILTRYEKQGNELLADTKIYVCSICGFIHIGDERPEICPVCKVPGFKFEEIRRHA